ncbi:MAG: hypothetical protein QOG37_367, partial [Mycobacterium sp.]|nr:hypothetical protein [Mycobacterium sp.]
GCKSALEDGVKVFCLGLDIMGFRRFCEHTVRIAGDSVKGTAYTRPDTPTPDFPPHVTSQEADNQGLKGAVQ